MRRFCANCGIEESSDVPIVNGFCIKCFVLVKKVLRIPNTIDIYTCSRCGAISIGSRWYYPSSSLEAQEIIEKYVASLIKPIEDVKLDRVSMELDRSSYRSIKVVSVIVIKNKHRFVYEDSIEIRWLKKICPTCFKKAGKSFKSVVQIRFVHLDDRAKTFIENIEKLFSDYIIEIEERDGGYDIKVVSIGIARKIVGIARKIWRSIRVTESFGDIKRARNGSRYAKLCISLEVLNLRVGDYVVLDGKAYTVIAVDEKKITVVDSDENRRSIDLANLSLSYERSKVKHSTK